MLEEEKTLPKNDMDSSEDDMNNWDLPDYMSMDKNDGRMRIYVDDHQNKFS